MKSAILVNGVPASGKSTVAAAIAAGLGIPRMTLDAAKEPLFAHFGVGDREHNRLLGRASYEVIFALMADWPDSTAAVIDAWFGFQPPDVLQKHLATAGIGRVVEVWCHAPGPVLAARYAARVGSRSAGHPGIEYVPELIALNDRAAPLGPAKVFKVDTTQALPLDDLLAWIRVQGIA